MTTLEVLYVIQWVLLGLGVAVVTWYAIFGKPIKDGHSFDAPDKKARRLDPAETFQVEIEITPEMRKKLRESTNPDCVICLGEGLHQTAAGEWRFCACRRGEI